MPELTATRMLPVPPARAFAALSDVDQLVRWWGPDGFTSTSQAFDFRVGGSWDVVLHGPDGSNYPNRYEFQALDAPGRAVVIHPDPVHWFELTILFDEAPGGTHVTWRQRFVDEAHFEEIKGFVGPANDQVLARLEAVVTG